MGERYAIVWGATRPAEGAAGETRRGEWRPTQHAAILDAVDLFWREPEVDLINIFCETRLISTVRRDDARIGATLAALDHAVRDVYEEDSA